MILRIFLALAVLTVASLPVSAQKLRIAAWNVKGTMNEGFLASKEKRAGVAKFAREVKPDIVLLTEVSGPDHARSIAEIIAKERKWKQYFGATSNFSPIYDRVFQGLEVAVISRIPIVSVTEYDASPDTTHETFTNGEGEAIEVPEVRLTSVGVSGISPMGDRDRGTLRVDLENGLTLFPIHLKSNTNRHCSNVSAAIDTLKQLQLPIPEGLAKAFNNGFALATLTHRRNAIKRERVMGAVALVAEKAIAEGRTVLIGGDFNTAYEPGKVGTKFDDCTLKNFSCAKGPFPEAACIDGDGFDDTLAILESALIGKSKWAILSKEMKRTYKDNVFADRAIDHLAVPVKQMAQFEIAVRGKSTKTSDHHPIYTDFTTKE